MRTYRRRCICIGLLLTSLERPALGLAPGSAAPDQTASRSAAVASSAAASRNAAAQSTSETPEHLIADATRFQLQYVQHKLSPLSYEVRRKDGKEDETRLLIESADGPVGRLVQRNRQPLTTEEDGKEQGRLRSLDAADMAHKRKGEREGEKFATELITAMPEAMLYSFTPGQPQLAISRPQFVLDFTANPAYHPSTTSQGLLSGLQGRLWIDREDHHVVRMEVHVVHDLNLAWGLLAKVYRGGTIDYDQRPVAPGQYAYSHIAVDVTLRELMVKTVPYHLQLFATNHHVLASAPTLQQAVQQLLGSAVPTAQPPQK